MEEIPVGKVTDFKAEQPSKQYEGSDEREAGSFTVSSAVQFWKVPSVVMLSGMVMCFSWVNPLKKVCVDVTEVK